jgi:predicted CoA-substrate-specific enzyme activase
MIAAGLDIGSAAAKAVLWDTEALAVRAAAQQPTGWEPERAGRECLAQVLAVGGVSEADLGGLVVTGYGRNLWRGGGRAVTEITCLARGVRQALPKARTVFDVGGQDSKVLSLEAEGRVRSFAVNDRCAAGTGRFLEMAAHRLGVSVAELGTLAGGATEGIRLSSLCAVFAESEIVGLLAQGIERERLARGLCEGVAQQLLHLAAGIPRGGPIALVGGVARNAGVVAALERALAAAVLVPEPPHLVVALGAALLAAEGGSGTAAAAERISVGTSEE